RSQQTPTCIGPCAPTIPRPMPALSIASSQLPPICLFFFNATATTEIYTLSLHDALPISSMRPCSTTAARRMHCFRRGGHCWRQRSEEHTSELQSRSDLVCRLLLEKKKRARRAGGVLAVLTAADMEAAGVVNVGRHPPLAG